MNKKEKQWMNERGGIYPASFVPAYDRLHPKTRIFLSAIDATGSTLDVSYFLPVDRLVRDLHGEQNLDRPTMDLWDKLIMLFPLVGANEETHKVSLAGKHLLPDVDGSHDAAGIRISAGASLIEMMNLTPLTAEKMVAGAYIDDKFIMISSYSYIEYIENGNVLESTPYTNATVHALLNMFSGNYVQGEMTYKTIYAGHNMDVAERNALYAAVKGFQQALNRA